MFFITLDDNIYGIHSQRENILYITSVVMDKRNLTIFPL